MKSELSGIFRVKLATKNIERGSSGTQFMHMRVKGQKFDRVIFPYIFKRERDSILQGL